MLIRKTWNRIIQDTWNIAIAEIGDDMTPVNIRWMKHDYTDRWFADPFILEETTTTFVILAEELIRSSGLGRICKLTIDKTDCRLIHNETLLELDTHLSFPNLCYSGEDTYIYPENSASGQLTFYHLMGNSLDNKLALPFPLIDPVLWYVNDGIILLGTLPKENNGNGNLLHIYKSDHLFGAYKEIQKIIFKDNIARRAGNVFEWNGKVIAPAQICNKHYGEGISFQELNFSEDGSLNMKEIKRLDAKKITKMTGFHTYNVFGEKVVIDGYKYGNEFIHDTYFKIRGLKNM